jgi:ribosomal protein S18 acetylase RimI-like enzyme
MDAKQIAGLNFRNFRGESDYAGMAAVLVSSEGADKIVRQVTALYLAKAYQNLANCDPYQDLVIAEVADEVVGYARGWWWDETSAGRLYGISGFVAAPWRRKGVGRSMQHWIEERMRQVAAAHPAQQTKLFQVDVAQVQEGKARMLQLAGYQVARYFYEMVRSNLDKIEEWPLPAGVELRPAAVDHYRAIWKSIDEGSLDEWGYTQATEEAYEAWTTNSHFQPHLWQIAWDGASDQVVGHVLTYIDGDENEQFGRKRGYTEGIGVDRAWRRRGLARALIARSLQAQKSAGMRESALVADGDNPNKATRLYESCGFRVVKWSAIYRKPLYGHNHG